MSAAMQIFSGPLALISIFFLWKSYFYGVLLYIFIAIVKQIENKINK